MKIIWCDWSHLNIFLFVHTQACLCKHSQVITIKSNTTINKIWRVGTKGTVHDNVQSVPVCLRTFFNWYRVEFIFRIGQFYHESHSVYDSLWNWWIETWSRSSLNRDVYFCGLVSCNSHLICVSSPNLIKLISSKLNYTIF